MLKRVFSLLMVCCMVATVLSAQQVERVDVQSDKMGSSVKTSVILPQGYDTLRAEAYPVVYLLHGYSGNDTVWHTITRKQLTEDATRWQMIFVCPDGKNSWYWDSPVNPKMQYETFVSQELVAYIDARYHTIRSPKGRAITGLSMGGHGAMFLAMNHPDVFGACGSMSGGVDIRPFPKSWNMRDVLGEYALNKDSWDRHTVINQLYKVEPGALAIIFDCGVDDFFYTVNEALHLEMLRLNIAHDYIVRPGNHTHAYWDNAFGYHLLFFSRFFNRE